MAHLRRSRAAVTMPRLALALATALAVTSVALAEQPSGGRRPSVAVDLSVLDTLPPPKGSYSGPRIVLRPLGAAASGEAGRKPDRPKMAPKPSPKSSPAPLPQVRDKAREDKPKPVVTAPPKPQPAKPAPRKPDPIPRQAAAPPAPAENMPAKPKVTAKSAAESETGDSPGAPEAKASPTPAVPAARPTGSNQAVAVVTPPAGKPKPDAGAASPAGRRTIAKPVTIAFEAGSGSLPKPPPAALDSLISQMTADEALRIVIYAYAKGGSGSASKARRLSFSRALAVRRYLVGKGVRGTRAEIRALGNKTEDEPADRVDLVLVKR